MKDFQQYYYDCAFQVSEFGDRRFTSGFTPHGIKCIDKEYSNRIINIGREVVQLIKIERTAHYKDGNYSSNWWDDYTELSLEEDFYSYDRVAFCYTKDNYIILEPPKGARLGRYQQRRLIAPEYTYTHPTYSAKHKGEDPKMLEEEIIKNPNLHPVIKDNLLENLRSRLSIEY